MVSLGDSSTHCCNDLSPGASNTMGVSCLFREPLLVVSKGGAQEKPLQESSMLGHVPSWAKASRCPCASVEFELWEKVMSVCLFYGDSS